MSVIKISGVSFPITSIEKGRSRRTVRIAIPGKERDVIQDMGAESLEISVEGVLYGPNSQTQRTQIKNMFESGTTVTYSDSEGQINVVVTNYTFVQEAGRREDDWIRFSLTLLEDA